LEVSQIARTIARCLRLNEDLTEAISLGHDLGHTPFGHAGEDKLSEICPYGFDHAKQSLRIVDFLESGKGLNLTYEVRDGIANHTSCYVSETPEGQIVQFADRIAYVNHDIDDAVRGGIITNDDIPKECTDILGKTHSDRIDTMIRAVINVSMNKSEVSMAEPIYSAMLNLRTFMFENVYIDSVAKAEEEKATKIIEALYFYYIDHPEEIKEYNDGDDVHRIVCDYIAGMSDSYAIKTYKDIFVPKAWHVV
ncbi:MAG: HD domain-containing protein, partial [Eubacteriales bacterium]|nr:HD domain-containing protein [Eubacteriales bacterium]